MRYFISLILFLCSNAVMAVEICHIPPGNPTNEHTINVAAPAVPAHLAHGDYMGPCGGFGLGGVTPRAVPSPFSIILCNSKNESIMGRLIQIGVVGRLQTENFECGEDLNTILNLL